MGAAYLAGLAVGYWESKEEIRKNWSIDRNFQPEISQAQRQERTDGWRRAVHRSLDWHQGA
jgi:glycerol kinase